MKLPSLILPAHGRSLNSDFKFWQRLTNTAAFWNAGSVGGTPAAWRASRKNCVFDRSGRDFESYPAPPKKSSAVGLFSPSSHWSFFRNSAAVPTTGLYFASRFAAARAITFTLVT